MKRKLSLLLALVMVLTLVPMSAFAASDNLVTRVASVDSDYEFTLAKDKPVLKIKNDGTTFRVSGETFRLVLSDSAEWRSDLVGTFATVTPSAVALGSNEKFHATKTTGVSIEATKITDQILQVTVKGTEVANKDFALFVPMLVDLDGAAGEVKVTIDPRDSVLTGGTYTFAVAAGGATVTTAGTPITMTRGTSTGPSIVIDEAVVGSLKANTDHKLRLRLPADFKWDSSKMTGSTHVVANGFVASPNTTVSGVVVAGSDSRDLEITFRTKTATSANRGSITITPVFEATREAKFGDVNVNLTKLKGDFSDATVKVAKYVDFDVTVAIKNNEVKEFLAGKLDETYKTAEITIKEEVAGSISQGAGQYIDFELPEWVKVTTGQSITLSGSNHNNAPVTILKDRSEFEIETSKLSASSAGKKELKFEIPVSISGTKTGDFSLKVKGAGIPEKEIVVGKAIAPVTAEVKVTDVKIGLQQQVAPEIIIKEAFPGAIEKGSLWLTFYDDIGFRFDAATVEVLEGDIDVNVDDSGRGTLGTAKANTGIEIVVKAESDRTPAVIKVKGIKMTVDRTAPEGLVKLDVKGNSVVDNNVVGHKDFSSRVARFDFANVITPAPGDAKSTAAFVIGANKYTVVEANVEVEKAMDVAPYINADGRTMLPIRYVAEALGVSSDNIIWNEAARTVTIMKGSLIVQMTIGSNVLTVNGVQITMDTVATIKDGRTVLPFRYAAQALGAEVGWDAATQTVTVIQ